MEFSDDFFDSESNSFFDDEELKSKVKECKEYVSNGQTIAYLNNIEETIQLCLEYDFVEDGIFLVEAALEISPYNSELWHSKGIFHNNQFNFEQAYYCFEKSLSLNPTDVEAMINKSIAEDNLGLWESAVKSLKTALTLEPHNEEAIFNLGILYERKDNFAKAIEYFKQTVYLDEKYTDAWYELGYCYESNNQLQEALDAYEKFLELDPYSASGRYNRGIVYLKLGENIKASGCFDLATSINENFVNAWYNGGIAYLNLNRLVDAKNSFLKAFQLDPFDDSIALNLAQTCESIGDYESAIKYYNATININKLSLEAYIGRGNCFARKNNFSLALENFAMILKVALAQEVEVLSSKENDEHLISLFNKIEYYNNLQNLSAEELNDLGNAYFNLGDWQNAFKVFKKSINLNPENSLAHYGKALCLIMLNKYQDALDNLQIAFELNTNLERLFLEKFPSLDSTQLYIKITSTL